MHFLARRRKFEDILPWSFIETGVDPQFLWEEYQRALEEKISPPCVKENCHRCGICDGKIMTVRECDPPEIRPRERMAKKETQKKGMRRKIRLKFRKVGEMRFLSHLELVHLFYRASKRADLPLCFSEGFHPLPRIVFATALPVGMESLTEIVDMECHGRITPGEVMERLNQILPQGIEMVEAVEVPIASPPSSLLHQSVYWIPLDHLLAKEEAIERIKRALEKEELLVHQERKGKKRSVDVRPLIQRMEVKESEEGSGETQGWGVELILRQVMGRTAKSSEIVGAILGLERETLAQCKVVKME